jgi:hypothetical protein
MKLIIAGSRTIDWRLALQRIEENLPAAGVTQVVSGGARGVDHAGEQWARIHEIGLVRFLPDWVAHGKQAGILRNIEMGKYADALLAVTTGSKGTEHMIDWMRMYGKPVTVIEVNAVGQVHAEQRSGSSSTRAEVARCSGQQ